MNRYIDADELVNTIFEDWGADPYYFKSDDIDGAKAQMDSLILERVNCIPTADVVPVVHAHFVGDKNLDYYVYCSNCDYEFNTFEEDVWSMKYCYNCGAKMDEKVKQ